jgi:hypothetical protein
MMGYMGKRWIIFVVALVSVVSLVWYFVTNEKFKAVVIQKTADITGNRPLPDELAEGFNPTETPPTFVIDDIDNKTGEWMLRMVWPEQAIQWAGQLRTRLYCDEGQITLVDYKRDLNEKKELDVVIDRVRELPRGSVRLSGKCQDLSCKTIVGDCKVYATVEVRE